MVADGNDKHDNGKDDIAHEIEVRVVQGVDGQDNKVQTPRLRMPHQLLRKVLTPGRARTEMNSEDGVTREVAECRLHLANSKLQHGGGKSFSMKREGQRGAQPGTTR